MIISVHIPKTAGSSFSASLNEHFGSRLSKDYKDLPLHHTSIKRNGSAIIQSARNSFREFDKSSCIHGHFLPLKYRFNKDLKYITWMREPAERLASQYYYMKREYNPVKAEKQPLLKKMIDENWSLERFCLGDELKNTYSKFFWGFPFSKFNFIGIVENYDKELLYFSEFFLKSTLKTHHKNINPNASRSYFQDEHFKNEILKFHDKDNILYKRAVRLMKKRY